MRSATIVGSTLALLAASACTVVKTTDPIEPAPSVPRAPSTAAALGIPPGHLPPPGQCRVWIPGSPPGHQPRARGCAGIEHHAPAGSWIVYRPDEDKKVVHVREVDERRAGVVVRRRIYDLRHGTLLQEN